MCMQNCIRLSAAVYELDFDREYLWNESSNRQAEKGVMNYNFCHVR